MTDTIPHNQPERPRIAVGPATLVIVSMACCGDPDLRPRCKRCAGTGADPNPGRAK